MKQPEYTEGPKALENFEKMATAIFQAPKPEGRETRKKSNKKASERKTKASDCGQNCWITIPLILPEGG
jgi:hypothetical protein